MTKLKGKSAELLRSTLVLFATCLLVTLAVAVTNSAFEDRIAQQNADSAAESMQNILPADSYEAVLTDDSGEAIAYSALDASGGIVGYIMITEANGYGGAVSVMTGIMDGEIVAVEVLDVSDETPGLGQNATSKDFTNQFAGLTDTPGLVKSNAAESEVQALTGATITSRAVVASIAEAFALYEEVR